MRWRLGCLVLGLVGCDAITPVEVSPAPVNACTVSADCARYPSDAGVGCFTVGGGPGACQTGTLGSYVLVVTVPSLAPVSAGLTFALESDTLFTVKSTSAVNLCMNVTTSACFRLPPLITAEGAYVVTQSDAVSAGQAVNLPGVDASVTLPVAATFWPEWPVPGGATDVRYLNLPVPPVTALVAVNASSGNLNLAMAYPPGSVTPDGGGAGGNLPIEWVAGLPPLPESSSYEGVIEVTPPFNAGFPDLQYAVSGASSAPSNVQLGSPSQLFEEPTLGLTVNRSDGAALGEGWTVYLRDHASHMVLSSLATLGKGETNARVDAFPNAEETNFDIVVEPPAGSILPEFVEQQPQAPLIPRQQLEPAIYPALPPIVHVSGTVRSAAGTPVSSTLLFYSTSIVTQATCSASAPVAGVGTELFYETVVATADQVRTDGGVGDFTVDLPHGWYVVVLSPSAASGYAKSVVGEIRVPAEGGEGCTGSSLTTKDTVLIAADPVTVRGHVVTADGRPVANATVEFTPSAAFAPSLDPARVPTSVFPSVTAGDRLPRPFSTTTGAQGTYSIQIDPHAGSDPHYDVTVIPQPGTGFPWVVRPDHVYFDGQSVDIVVPAPSFMSLTLEDSEGNLLANAIVQAYAFTSVPVPNPSNQPVPLMAPVAVQIGQAMTDTSGHFSMMLTTTFAP